MGLYRIHVLRLVVRFTYERTTLAHLRHKFSMKLHLVFTNMSFQIPPFFQIVSYFIQKVIGTNYGHRGGDDQVCSIL